MTAFLSRLLRRPREDAPVWIEVGELQRRLAASDAVVVVDVRQPEEFTAPPGHLPGAVNVPLADLSGRAGELAARREPVVLNTGQFSPSIFVTPPGYKPMGPVTVYCGGPNLVEARAW